jgi:transcription initiation factor TFIIIB Brf1 subunit/transcription initiation factor TFIIB
LHVADDLGSFIGYYGQWTRLNDHSGRSIPSHQYREFQRLKRIHDVFLHADDKTREYSGLRVINWLAGRLELGSQVRDKAASVFSQVQNDLKEVATIDELAAGAVYLSIRTTGVLVRLSDIMMACDGAGLKITPKKLMFAAGVLRQKAGGNVRTPRPEDYVEKVVLTTLQHETTRQLICSMDLDQDELTETLRGKSMELAHVLSSGSGGSRNPFILACAVLVGADMLLAMNGKYGDGRKRGILTQRAVARLNGVKEYTLREHFLDVVKPIVQNSA